MKNFQVLKFWFFLFPVLCHQNILAQQMLFHKEVAELTNIIDVKGWKKGSVVFTGSSSIRMWKNLPEEFPDFMLINTGFGGSQASDLLQHLEVLVLRFDPSAIFIYAGDNDVNAGKTPEAILKDLKQILIQIRLKTPYIPVYFMGAKPSPSRWKLQNEYHQFNKELQQFIKLQPNTHYIDVWNPMLNQDGQPRPELFLTDLLHMKPSGYEIWKNQIKKPMNSLKKFNLNMQPIINLGIQIVPKSQKLDSYWLVDQAIEVIQKSGIKHVVTPFETVMEGTQDELMAIAKKAQQAVLDAGADELLVYYRIQIRNGTNVSLEDKIEKYHP